MIKRIVVMKIQPSICLDDIGKPPQKSQVGRHLDLNSWPLEYESSTLPRGNLARYFGVVENYRNVFLDFSYLTGVHFIEQSTN